MTRLSGYEIKMPSPCVLTVGKFEGIHLGHQKLITEMVSKAKRFGLPSAVFTFNPHPNVLFSQPEYKSLFTIAEREYILSGMGVDYLLVFPFDRAFASQTPQRFAELLFADLNARVIYVGEGFRYGSGQRGTERTLRAEAEARGAQVITVPTRDADESGKISTSDIRKLVAERDLAQAAGFMGFQFFIMGTVERGKRIGSRIGYPTVNILPPGDKLLPPDGVYATATFAGGKRYASVTNVGLRPTVNAAQDGRTVESYLIGYNGDLYGAEIRTEFHTFIRPEQKFNGIDELRGRIAKDAEQAAGIMARVFD
jgi:riboflavin kinase/FMN adenylyltransferase